MEDAFCALFLAVREGVSWSFSHLFLCNPVSKYSSRISPWNELRPLRRPHLCICRSSSECEWKFPSLQRERSKVFIRCLVFFERNVRFSMNIEYEACLGRFYEKQMQQTGSVNQFGILEDERLSRAPRTKVLIRLPPNQPNLPSLLGHRIDTVLERTKL